MTQPKYTPGDPVAVGDLEIGDVIFATKNRATGEPEEPVKVVLLTPSANPAGLVAVTVQSIYERWMPHLLDARVWLALTREYTRAVEV